MEIFRLTQITDDILEAFAKLMPQLGEDLQTPTKAFLQEVIDFEGSYIFVAKDEKILGTLSLVVYKIPSGSKARIEDVIVDVNARGKGVASKLLEAAIAFADEMGIHKMDLTSNPSRKAAHALYEKMGFEEKNTSVFRLLIVK